MKQQAKVVGLQELKGFANTFLLQTPIPKDLVKILAKDPAKQQEIMARQKLIITHREKAASVSKRTSDGLDGYSEAARGDSKLPPEKHTSTETLPTPFRDPSIVTLRPAPPPPPTATKSWAAIVAADVAQPAVVSTLGDEQQFERPVSRKAPRKANRKKKRRGANGPDSSHNN